ncbi:MAG: hypothetical protein KAJ12_09770 [Bacteroidetes bacterium]|nr:hypothetical protein [Bacteroidota bacterium]
MAAWYSEAIRQNIAKKDWEKLSDVLIGAEKVSAGKNLRAEGWYRVGLYEAERGNHPSAIIALNSARTLTRKPEISLEKMFEELERFCEDFDGDFSRADLYMLSLATERVGGFISFHQEVSGDLVEKARQLSSWIESRLSTAPVKKETRATHHVQRIYSALYPPMTIEEVRAEFARIVEPLIRERLERKAKAASGGGGKGPKDPDEDRRGPPEKNPKKAPKKKRKGKK